MSSGSVSRSGAKPNAGPLVPAVPLLPSTKGSSISDRNWLVIWNPTCCAPVAASPDTCESARTRSPPARKNRFPKPGVSVPPLLK
jgi:hypothetical protein